MTGLPCFGFVACLTEHGIVRRTIAKRRQHILSFSDCNGSTVRGQRRSCDEAKTRQSSHAPPVLRCFAEELLGQQHPAPASVRAEGGKGASEQDGFAEKRILANQERTCPFFLNVTIQFSSGNGFFSFWLRQSSQLFVNVLIYASS
jgi:hypothetical protein